MERLRALFLDVSRKWMPDVVELNRLLMNYVYSTYSLREHLKTHIFRDFGRESEAAEMYGRFLHNVEQKSRSYAFMQDFRNYVQHCGFPVGKAFSKESINGRVLSLLYPKCDLLSNYAGWGKSRLREWPEAEIDLSAITAEYHEVIIKEFPAVILAAYGSEIGKNVAYFASLHDEAKNLESSAIAVMVTSECFREDGGNCTLEEIPYKPLAELGLVSHCKRGAAEGATS